MRSPAQPGTAFLEHIRRWWKQTARDEGYVFAARALFAKLWEFLRDSTPWRLRQRYGDSDYDWDHRVNTTSAAVGWRERLVGLFHSPYQPTDPDLFQEMLDHLKQLTSIDFRDFTFVDLGSGKGRTLLMASDYPFRRILGVELLPTLHEIARENVSRYYSARKQCSTIESVCADATNFPLPQGPLLIYLFHPFPESGLREFLRNLERSLAEHEREVYLLYHNPLLESVLAESRSLKKIGGTHQYSIYKAEFVTHTEGT
jgi:SAM-dependent methyltransferase